MKKNFLEGEPLCPSVTYFSPALDSPLGKFDRNTFKHMRGHEQFIPTKFRKHPLNGSVVKADYMFP